MFWDFAEGECRTSLPVGERTVLNPSLHLSSGFSLGGWNPTARLRPYRKSKNEDLFKGY